ncbi:hypothetical protein, partial [Streptomyces sp. SID5910]|uniref:hypothetical protein n=1 Tax=Streptomyces sp. SID5910 TaxID=2690312 RepID=UPI0013701159
MQNDALATRDRESGTTSAVGRLLRALTDPEFTDEEGRPDPSQVTDEELGSLFVAAYRVDTSAPLAMRAAAATIRAAARDRRPRYTPAACRRLFELLVEECGEHGWADLTLGLDALRDCTGPVPDVSEPARSLVGMCLVRDVVRQPYALLAVAALAGKETLTTAVERLSRDVGPIVADETAVIAGLPPAEQAVLSEMDREHRFVAPLAHTWHRSADNPAYVAFARRALETAADRTD